MQANSYLIDNALVKSLTDSIINLVFVSSLLMGIPILVYIWIVVAVTKVVAKAIAPSPSSELE